MKKLLFSLTIGLILLAAGPALAQAQNSALCTPPTMVVFRQSDTSFRASGCASSGDYTVRVLETPVSGGDTSTIHQEIPVSPAFISETFALEGQLPQVDVPTIWRFQFVRDGSIVVNEQSFRVEPVDTSPGGIDIEGDVESELTRLNPLNIGNTGDTENQAEALSTPAGILSRFLSFVAFPLAGLILFVMIVWGGFEILAGSATKKSVDAGRQRITAAIFGFILLFTAYWAAQIIEVVFGIQIL